MIEEKDRKAISRKDFLKGAGTSLAGIAIAGGISTALTGCVLEEEVIALEQPKIEIPKWPFTYKKLDPDKAAERGYLGYKEGG